MPDLIIVLPNASVGGIAIKCRKLVEHWEKQGRSLLVVSLKTPTETHPFKDYPDLISLRKYTGYQPKRNLFASWLRLLKVRKLIKQNPKAKVVAFGQPANMLCVLATTGLKNPVIVSHFTDPRRNNTQSLHFKITNAINQKATLNIVNTKGGLTTLQKLNPTGVYAYIPNPLDTQAAPPLTGEKPPIIAALGRLSPLKSHHLMIDAFSHIADRHPEWRLQIIGDGPNRKTLSEQIKNAGLQNRVELLGYVDHPLEVLATVAIFIQFSSSEGIATSLMEAMLLQCACITADSSPGPLELIEHQTTGLVTPYPDVGKLGEAIETLICDPTLRKQLGKQASKHIQMYDKAHVLKIWDSYI